MITQLFGQQDLNNDYTQWETNDGAVYQTLRFTNPGIEGGRLTLNYNAINTTTGVSADRVKMARWKIINGVASVPNVSVVYTNNDTGMNGVDVNVIPSGTEVIITLTGVAGQTIRHTLHIVKVSSVLNQ